MATAAIVAGTVLTAGSMYQSGETNEAIAKHNAVLGEFRAQDSERRGKVLAQQQRKEFEQIKGSNRVAFATQNIALDTGTPALLEAETDMLAELAVNTTQTNAALEAWGLRASAQQSVLEGKLASQAGALGAAGTLLSGAGQAAVAARTPK